MKKPVNRKILIIDDNREIHSDFRRIFSSDSVTTELDQLSSDIFGDTSPLPDMAAFEIDSAYQGQEGFDLVQTAISENSPFALAFVDIRMPPGWDGIETIKRLWEVDPNLQVVICTAYSDYNLEQITRELGKTDRLLVLKKPFDIIEVRQMALALSEKWYLARKATKAQKALNRQNELLDELVAERTGQLEKANAQLREEIEQRRHMEEKLLESDSLYRMLTSNMTDLVSACNQEMNFTYVSPSHRSILGYNSDELLGEPIVKLVHEDDLGSITSLIGDRRDSLKPATAVYRMRHKDGHDLWFETIGKMVFDPEQKPLGAVFSTREITDRKNAEDELKKSEERYRLLADNIKDVIWIRDLATMQFTYISPSIEAASGYTVEEAMQLSWEQTLTPEAIEQVQASFVEQMMLEQDPNSDPDRSVTMILQNIRKDGSIVWNEVHASFIRNEDGQAVAMMGVSRDITDRKEAENALRESENRYRLVADNIHDVIWVRDLATMKFTFVSPSIVPFLGYSIEEVMELTWEKSLAPESAQSVQKLFAEEIAKERKQGPDPNRHHFYNLTLETIRKDGFHFWQEVSASFIRDKQGNPKAILGISRDISERKRAENALQESEERFRSLAENIPGVIYLCKNDDQYSMFFLNDEVERLTGYKKEAFLNNEITFVDLYHPDDKESIFKTVDESLAKKKRFHLVYRLKTKDDQWKWIEEFGIGMYQGDQLTFLEGFLHDITERKQAEQSLKESEEAYRSLAEKSLQGLIVVRDNVIKYANQTFADISGYTVDEILNLSPVEVANSVHPDDRKIVLKRMHDRLAGKSVPDRYEYRVIRKDGKVRWVDVRAATVEYRGELSNQASFVDVTERKLAEQALKESEERYRLLAENATDIVWAMGLDACFTYMSPSIEKMTGFTAEQVIQKPLQEWLTSESFNRVSTFLAEEASKPKEQRIASVTMELQQVTQDGLLQDIETNATWILDDSGNPIGIQGINRDISQRKMREKRAQTLNRIKEVLLVPGDLDEKIKQITDGIMEAFSADFCRVWMIHPGDLCDQGCFHGQKKEGYVQCDHRDRCLHLMASSGRYTHLDGELHRRVPFGHYKIGKVASGQMPKFVTNHVTTDPNVHDHQWAAELGLASFAGYRLLSSHGEVEGVLALFSKNAISAEEDAQLEDLAHTAAQAIQTAKAIEALRESEENFRHLFEFAPDAYYIHDLNGVLVDGNKAAEELTGYSRNELIGSDFTQIGLLSYDQIPLALEGLQKNLQGLPSGPEEFTLTRKDGQQIVIETRDVPIKLKDQTVVLGIMRDVTESRQIELALRKSEERFRTIFNSSNIAIAFTDRNAHPLFVNPAFEKMFGYKTEEIDPDVYLGLTHPEDLVDTANQLNRLADGDLKYLETEKRYIHKDGTVLWGRLILSPIRGEDGTINNMIAMIEDITEKKRAQEEMWNQEKRMSRLQNAIVKLMVDHSLLEDTLEDAVRDMTEIAAEALEVEFASVRLFSDNRTTLKCFDMYEQSTKKHSLAIDMPIDQYPSYFQAIESNRLIDVQHADTDPRTIEIADLYLKPIGITSLLSIGIRYNGKCVGVLAFGHIGPARQWYPEETNFAKDMAEQVSQFLSARDRVQTIRRLHTQRDLAVALSEKKSLYDTLQSLLKEILQIEDIDAGGIYLVDEYTNAIDLVVHEGLPEGFAELANHFAPGSSEATIALKGNSVFSNFRQFIEKEKGEEEFFSFDLKALAVLPVRSEGKTIAVLNLTSYTTDQFDEGVRVILEGISAQVGGMIARVKAEEELRHRHEVSRIVAEISTRFINTPPEQTDNEINRALKLLGQSMQMDRSYVFLYNAKNDSMTNSHEWCAEGIEAQIDNLQNVPADAMPWWMEKLRKNQTLHVPKVSEMPKEASVDQALLEQQDIQSVLVIPQFYANELIGFFGFDSVRHEKHWPSADAEALRAVGTVLTNAIMRLRQEEERGILEDQLRQSQKMEAIGRLAGGVAHDFNNILTGITGYAEMLLASLGPGDPIYGDLEEIHRAGERAAGLTAQLLAFSRKQIISPKVVQLNDAIANSQKMLARIIGEDIELKFYPSSDLGPIKIDPAQVDQVLINLAANARDAMPNGGRLTIETSKAALDGETSLVRGLDVSGDYILLKITDNGQGMDEETIEHIFEPFFSTKGKHEGTGLGLATVYGIVKQNNGYINVESSLEKGTTFLIYFPESKNDGQKDAKREKRKLPMGTETVLLVEDEMMVRGLARKILSKQGYQVLEAQNGGEALMMCESFEGQIHLLLTDVIMPKMNGKELYDRLHQIRPDLRVLFMSGYTEDVIAHHGVLDEETQFLQKPFTIESLAKKVHEVLKG